MQHRNLDLPRPDKKKKPNSFICIIKNNYVAGRVIAIEYDSFLANDSSCIGRISKQSDIVNL